MAAVCVLLAAVLPACTEDSATGKRVLELESRARSLEQSLASLSAESSELKNEIAALRREQADLKEGQIRTGERLDDLDSRLRILEAASSKTESDFPSKEQWAKDKGHLPGAAVETTARLVEESGGEVHYFNYFDRETSILVVPLEFVDGETPLIVSLHGFGGDSAYQAAYVPLHQRVDTHGFALLLPNGQRDGQGGRFWNPTDECCEGGKTGEDDVAFLTGLLAGVGMAWDFGPVYFFGYSNGGFMSHHMACKGLPGLRAVASLAGTSYVEDSSCDGAPPVSVLHVHGTEDGVILYEGAGIESGSKGGGGEAFYLGAQEMATRWSRRAGCDWPEDPQPYAVLDLDQSVPGAETQAFRQVSECAEGISVELWVGEGSSHAPGYGDAFVDALLGWLLSQE